MKVKEFMSSPVISISPESSVRDAASLMCENGISVLPVINQAGKLEGILTESDFVGKEAQIPHALASVKRLFGFVHNFTDVESVYKKSQSRKVKEVMTKNVKYIGADNDLSQLVELMARTNLKRVPIVDNGFVVGIVTRKDLINAFLKA